MGRILYKGWYYLVPTDMVENSRELFKVEFKDKSIKANVFTTIEVVLEEGVRFEGGSEYNKFIGNIVVDKNCIFDGERGTVFYDGDPTSVLLLKNVRMSDSVLVLSDVGEFRRENGRVTIFEDTEILETVIRLSSRDIIVKGCVFSKGSDLGVKDSVMILNSGIYFNSQFYKDGNYETVKLLGSGVMSGIIVEDSVIKGRFSLVSVESKLGIISNITSEKTGNYTLLDNENKPIRNDEQVV